MCGVILMLRQSDTSAMCCAPLRRAVFEWQVGVTRHRGGLWTRMTEQAFGSAFGAISLARDGDLVT